MEGNKFRRQHKIGAYIVDFCCFERKLIVELDGGQHASQKSEDDSRTNNLTRKGYYVIRFWSHDVLNNTDAVLETIRLALISPHPAPLPKGEGKKGNATHASH